MRLRITTPLSVVVDEDGILSLRAEDATGSFGILPRHADFLTSLAISITNLGSPLTSWTLGYSYSGNQQLAQGWNGTLSVGRNPPAPGRTSQYPL